MVGVDPSISLSDLTKLPAKLHRKLEDHGIHELTQLFLFENKLQDAISLAENVDLTIREVLEARHFGRRHFESILAEITAKRKVEPLELLWKIHWLLGIVPEGEYRNELIALEASAIATILESLEAPKTPIIEKVFQILLHRLLIISETTMKAELEQLIEFAEKYQRTSLLAYQTTKVKDAIIALADEEDPAKQIVLLRKLSNHWKTLKKTMEDRGEEKGKTIVTALHAFDGLKILDISEHHLKDRLQQTMSTQKLRQSQLKHITTAMNTAIELRDAHSTAKFATRASQIWFELAQGKSGKALGDDLLRSLRFSRTAVFHYRALDDFSGAVKQLDQIILIVGEVPSDYPEILEEAITGTVKTLVNTIPLLDRPADQELILRISKRLDTLITRLMPKLRSLESRFNLIKLHVRLQQTALVQLQQLGASSETHQTLNRELIKTLLQLTEAAPEQEKDSFLNTAAEHGCQLIPEITPSSKINPQDLEVVSQVAQQLAQRPAEVLSDAAHHLLKQSNQLNEQLYFQTKDPQIRAQLALQLLLSQVSPDPAGKVTASFPTKELDKLEDYATTAMLAQAKGRQQVQALKAGSLLVWILLQRMGSLISVQGIQKLKEDAREFADQTFAFMPSPSELTSEAFPFALLLLRNINALAYNEHPADESQWEQLLTQSEQLAQTLAKTAAAEGDTRNEVLALSAAGMVTAKLATLTSSRNSQTRLLRRATTQIQKALQAAASNGNPADIEAVLSQYTHLMRARLTVTSALSAQTLIFQEWDQTYREGVEALQDADAEDVANRLQAAQILNAKIPLIFILLSRGKDNLDSIRRQLTETLHEAAQLGSKEQTILAQQLERRWAFQLSDDSLLDSGFRLEDAETSFTLADEHFRISLQVETEVAIDGKVLQKTRTFPYLQVSSKPTELIWYDISPVLCSTYAGEKLQTWLTLENPTENSVSIGFSLTASEDLMVSVTLQILATEALSQGPKGVAIQIAGAQLELPRQPAVAEHREEKGLLIYDLDLSARFPSTISLNIQIA
jgi:hypothetical protein